MSIPRFSTKTCQNPYFPTRPLWAYSFCRLIIPAFSVFISKLLPAMQGPGWNDRLSGHLAIISKGSACALASLNNFQAVLVSNGLPAVSVCNHEASSQHTNLGLHKEFLRRAYSHTHTQSPFSYLPLSSQLSLSLGR